MSLTMEDYNPRNSEKIVSFVVRGDTELYADQLRMMGGRWNTNLIGGAGWLFSARRHRESVKRFLRQVESLQYRTYDIVCLALLSAGFASLAMIKYFMYEHI